MTFRVPGSRGSSSRPIVLPRWPRFVVPTAIIVVVLAVLVAVIAGIWTDYLWYSSVHQTRVFDTTYSVKWLLFVITAVFMAGLISGLIGASDWRTWLLFINRVPFGRVDPQFRMDISFFVFVYPFLRMLLAFLFTAVLFSLILAAVVHVLYGGLRLARRVSPTKRARAHLFVLAGVFIALKAAAYWVDRYGINFSQRGVVQTGASYTDVNAVLPAKTVLAVIAVICAALFLAGAVRRGSLLPGIGFGLLVLSAVLIGGVYPLIIQQFVVKRNEQVKERTYITREINSTRQAYGITGHTAVIPYTGISTASTALLAKQAATVPDLRLMDPGVVTTTFEQLQQVKSYYHFVHPLSMDRYTYGSSKVPQDTVVGVRDMAAPPAGQGNWINTHLIYTHGYGFVAAAAATSESDGSPTFSERDIPPTGALKITQPRVYFGHEGAGYVIVGGRQPELDYPNVSLGGQQNTTYRGGGGVPIGSFGSRLLFAIRFRELNIMLSSAINSNSRILYIRDPLARVEKVAPFLTLDSDPYPVIAGGQVLWVVDGYTTTDNYPYSKRINLGQASSNTYSPGGLEAGPSGQVNYIRNSVKATVNAYTGAVHLYQWSTASPVLSAWMKSFPGLISPSKDIPPSLLPHLRYPEGLFDAQRLIITQFHVQDPAAFYGGQNFWAVPPDPSILLNRGQQQLAGISQPPYYLTLGMPGTSTPDFSLAGVLTFHGRQNLAAFVAVNSDPQSARYGQITVLQLPQNQVVSGPAQIQNQFESDPVASVELTQLRKGGSRVTQGNLVTVPLGGSLLSIEPVYVSASAQANTGSYPQLKRVFTYFNGQVGYASTLAGSLAQLFGSLGQPAGGAAGGPSRTSGGQVNALVLQYLNQAARDYSQAQAALRGGRLGLFYQEIQKMNAALVLARTAAQASKGGTPPGVSPAPAPPGSRSSASPSPSPSRSH